MTFARSLHETVALLIKVALLALITTVLVRQVIAPRGLAERPGPVYHDDWRDILVSGHHLGQSNADITIVEFGDFECPYCRVFWSNFAIARHEIGDVALVYVHFPLGRHRFAMPAARAAECASEQGRFLAMHDLLLSKQDSLGLKSWDAFAVEAGVGDESAFRACIDRSEPFERIEGGLSLAERFEVTGTPGLIINGWYFPGGLSTSEMVSAVHLIRDGMEPRYEDM